MGGKGWKLFQRAENEDDVIKAIGKQVLEDYEKSKADKYFAIGKAPVRLAAKLSEGLGRERELHRYLGSAIFNFASCFVKESCTNHGNQLWRISTS